MAEAHTLLTLRASSARDVGFLLDEAFHGGRALKLFLEVDNDSGWTDVDVFGDGAPSAQSRAGQVLLAELARDAHRIPMWSPRRYFSARQVAATAAPSMLTAEQVRTRWADLIVELDVSGYLEDEFGPNCSDAEGDPVAEGCQRLAELLGTDKYVWPLLDEDGDRTGVEKSWTPERFADMVEVFHDLIARPRTRWVHNFHDGYDFSDYARAPGRALYRWRVNELLARSDLGLSLIADDASDGWLVRAPADARAALPERAVDAVPAAARTDVSHALMLWRSRAATREDKRSAIVALAGYLENQRQRMKTHLLPKDEDALFEVLNRFDLRHRRADQRTDYDEVFLDWLFWWYLATIELVGRLQTRDGLTGGS